MKLEKSGLEVEQDDLFRSRLSSILDHRHPLYVLAEAIDWETLEREARGVLCRERGTAWIGDGLDGGLVTRSYYLQLDKSSGRELSGGPLDYV